MKRSTQQFLDLADQLDRELENSNDIFFEQRPWLLGADVPPEVLDRSDQLIERKVENDIAIEELVKEIKHEAYK